MKKTIFLIFFISFVSITAYAGDAWCKVSANIQNNIGYCTEGIDGKGKCLKNEVANASRCSDDQPEEEQIGF